MPNSQEISKKNYYTQNRIKVLRKEDLFIEFLLKLLNYFTWNFASINRAQFLRARRKIKPLMRW